MPIRIDHTCKPFALGTSDNRDCKVKFRLLDFLNSIHERQALEPLEVRVQPVVDPLRFARWVEELIAEWQAYSIEPRLFDLIEHILPVAGFQAVRGKGVRLKPKPVDTRQVNVAACCIHQLTTEAMEETYRGPGLALY